MQTNNGNNERIKHRYFVYLREARRMSEASVDTVAAALHRFEVFSNYREFRAFHYQQAVAFKRNLVKQVNPRNGDRLSKATVYAILMALRNFFFWLAGQPGFRSRFSYTDAEYFSPSAKDTHVAKAKREQRAPTLDQLRRVLFCMPSKTPTERRDRAVIAFTMLTGARDGATISLKIKHLDLNEHKVTFDARQVSSKFAKTFITTLFPIGDEVRQVLVDWVDYLQHEQLFGLEDPLFPSTDVIVGAEQKFEAAGLSRRHWRSATPIRVIFRRAFERVGLRYSNPHSVRNTLAIYGEKLCRTPEQFKAWSQNMGHEKVLTTFSSYGVVGASRQSEIIRELGQLNDASAEEMEIARQLIRAAKRLPG